VEYIDVFISSAFDAAVRWISVGILPYGIIGVEKLERRGYPKVKKNDDIFSRFDTIPACNGHTNRQRTSCESIVRAMHTHRAVKTGRKDTEVTCCSSLQFHTRETVNGKEKHDHRL